MRFMDFLKKNLGIYADRRILVMGLIGYSCGIPLFLTASTLALWLKQAGISNTQIGALSLCALPYTIKFFWSPLLDRLKIPYLTQKLGRRRSWLLVSQLGLMAGIIGISLVNPVTHLYLTIPLATFISFAAATQDVVMLAYQVERLGQNQYGAGEAMGILGFRMGMLTSGAGALYLAESLSWNQVYFIMGCIIGVGVLTTLFVKEPDPVRNTESLLKEEKAREYLHTHPRLYSWQAKILSWLYGAVICPFSDFMTRNFWMVALLIMFFFKLSDNLIGNMTNIFFADIGYSKSEIASASKVFGMANSILGGFIGGILIVRLGMVKSLFYSALVHGISIMLYVSMAYQGYDLGLLYTTVAIDHITSGMRTTALFAYQMTLVNPVYAATQLALLTSIVHLGRTTIGSTSGWLVDQLGWASFFELSTLSTILSLLLVAWLAKLEGKKQTGPQTQWQQT